ncbi:MAG: pseudaminic acid synthase [Promethearchaeota archaeon]
MSFKEITINDRKIGKGNPTYIVAELSANHNRDLNIAKRLIHSAKDSGADAVKLQTYTPDTMTLNLNNEYFQIQSDSAWAGKTLYELYEEAYMPWEWQEELVKIGKKLGITVFSSPFDHTAVDFLESLDIVAYKIASFEITDLPLIRKITKTGKPIMMSTGMASLAEIDEAVQIIKKNGNELVLLHCTSSYPASSSEMNIQTITRLKQIFNVPIGLSDHFLGNEIAIASVALGACVIEKHFTLDRSIKGPDSFFSIEPHELTLLIKMIRNVEQALGDTLLTGRGEDEKKNLTFRRSIFTIKDISAGDKFNQENVKIIRPAFGLSPRYWDIVLKSRATKDISKGTPLSWDMISG